MIYHERTSKRGSNVRVSRRKPASYGWFCHIWGKRLILKAFDLNDHRLLPGGLVFPGSRKPSGSSRFSACLQSPQDL
uniref:Uncharacterized protein n=1 Tax=Vibrio sp. VP6(2010) TaxID=749335 RepID=D5JEJ0_9VIBR|nr:hypothetical protein repV6-ORF1 [Vibrio sp. VP6(2010)]